MNSFTNRRHFLRGTGALIALPALASIGFRPFASAAQMAKAAPSKRAVFLGIGFGVTKETWYPDLKGSLRGLGTKKISPWCRAAPTNTAMKLTGAVPFG